MTVQFIHNQASKALIRRYIFTRKDSLECIPRIQSQTQTGMLYRNLMRSEYNTIHIIIYCGVGTAYVALVWQRSSCLFSPAVCVRGRRLLWLWGPRGLDLMCALWAAQTNWTKWGRGTPSVYCNHCIVVFSPSTYLSSSSSILLLPSLSFPSFSFSTVLPSTLCLPSHHSHPTLPSLHHLPPLSSLSPGGSCGGVILWRGGPCTCVLLHFALVLPGHSLLAGYQGLASWGHEGQERWEVIPCAERFGGFMEP